MTSITPNFYGSDNVGVSTANFLRIYPGARGVAMGESLNACFGDTDQLFVNPAGLASVSKQFSATHMFQWLVDVRNEAVSFSLPLGERAGIGINLNYLNMGSDEITDRYGVPTGEFASAYDYSGAVGIGVALGDKITLGASVKYINSYLVDISAKTHAFDFGIIFKNECCVEGLNTSFNIRNLGPDLALNGFEEPLPLQFIWGESYIKKNIMLAFAFVIDLYFDNNETEVTDSSGRFGIEYNLREKTFFRAGSKINESNTTGNPVDTTNELIYNASFGIGQRINNKMYIDIAVIPFRRLGVYNLITFSMKL